MWRGLSVRKLALLLLGPLLVEMLSMLFNAWMPLQAADRMGKQPRQVMLIGMIGAVAYASSSLIAGRWVRPAIAPGLMIGAVLATLVVGCATLYINAFWFFPIAAAMIGLLYGHYYVPFQINIGHAQPFRTLAWSIAFYNMAWGMGSAIGTLLGGALVRQPVVVIAAIALGVAVIHTLLQVLALLAPSPSHEILPGKAFASTPRHRRVAIVCFLAAGLGFRAMLLTLWPSLKPIRGFEEWQVGLGYFMLSAPIALLAPLWALLRRRLREPWIMIGSLPVAAVGLMILPLTEHWLAAMAALLLIGAAESCCAFHAIYYANADPKTAARSVGLIEMFAGAGSMLGPLLLGLIAWNDAASPAPYLAAVALLAAAFVYALRDRLKHGPL
jgi:MFS family permease